ncbi:MAG: transposase [Pirellula sp.]|jgi:transposase|nr:transposase [Pirellula sp.]
MALIVNNPISLYEIDSWIFAGGSTGFLEVEAVSEGNDTNAAVACFSKLSEKQIASVEAIAMDMSSAYVKAAKQVIPLAESKIVHDRFHVMQLVYKAVDKVRKKEHRSLLSEGDKRLSGTKYVWLRSFENQTI